MRITVKKSKCGKYNTFDPRLIGYLTPLPSRAAKDQIAILLLTARLVLTLYGHASSILTRQMDLKS